MMGGYLFRRALFPDATETLAEGHQYAWIDLGRDARSAEPFEVVQKILRVPDGGLLGLILEPVPLALVPSPEQ